MCTNIIPIVSRNLELGSKWAEPAILSLNVIGHCVPKCTVLRHSKGWFILLRKVLFVDTEGPLCRPSMETLSETLSVTLCGYPIFINSRAGINRAEPGRKRNKSRSQLSTAQHSTARAFKLGSGNADTARECSKSA